MRLKESFRRVEFDKQSRPLVGIEPSTGSDVIKIMVQCLDWACGNQASFDLMLSDDTTIMVDWNDGHAKQIYVRKGIWQQIEHFYSEKHRKEQTPFIIRIEVVGNERIIGFRLVCLDMRITGLDFSESKELQTIIARFMPRLDVSTCTKLKELDISNGEFESIDLSANEELEILNCDYSKLRSLKLSRCNKLRELYCSLCWGLTNIGLSNNSALVQFECGEDSAINDKSMKFIREIIEKNNGTVQLVNYGYSVIFLNPDNVLKSQESIDVLRRIINETGCKIVITSDWKKPFEDETASEVIEGIRQIWKERNLPGTVLDVTPNLNFEEIFEMSILQEYKYENTNNHKGFEIENWRSYYRPDNYIIIDSEETAYLPDVHGVHYYCTDLQKGLTKDDLDYIIDILKIYF